MKRAYVAPTASYGKIEALSTGVQRGYSQVPGQPQMMLVYIYWPTDGNEWANREILEADPNIQWLGEMWDPVSASAVSILEAFRQAMIPTRQALVAPALKGAV